MAIFKERAGAIPIPADQKIKTATHKRRAVTMPS
jgi:hypothetical protein